MPLRCLLFSSNEEMVQPIWQVLTDLGIEGEYCRSAVDAVERVTTQLFQIVITDWEDQPEAAFLLKTARDLKAAQRPLTLAIVSDDARLPEALQAGANSVLVKPIRAEQVRDTMSTACELLRSKFLPSAPPPGVPSPQPAAPETAVMAAAASTGAAPVSVTPTPEKIFRAGEFLQPSSSAPGAQFDTECEVQKSLDQAAAAEVDALSELEPMAAAVKTGPAEPAEPVEPQEPLTGWASLQARLTKAAPQPTQDASATSELLSYGETPSYSPSPAIQVQEERPAPKKNDSQPDAEAALFSYMAGESKESARPVQAQEPRSKVRKIFLIGTLAIVCILAALPRTRQSLRVFYRNGIRAGGRWLNPPPAPLPQPVALHDSFGQSGDEYNLPPAANIPDATTDPSQIRVLPVIDPTAKPAKGTAADAAQSQPTVNGSSPSDQNQTAPAVAGQSQGAPTQLGEDQVKNGGATSVGNIPGNAVSASPGPVGPAPQVPPNAPVSQGPAQPPLRVEAPMHNSAPQPAVPTPNSAGIPSSLKSQIASMTPEGSGAKPPEAAMSSIEPVSVPEAVVLELLAQPVDPVYPDAAKAGGQRGSVVLQVLIGRDGTVQDAKFLQGSLVFARAAIDAVKQWRFKPYSLNGRAVAVQSTITLSFKPPA
jgi:protein TonB